MVGQNKLINDYLNDENKLYQDWYRAVSQEQDATMKQIAKPPSLPELKEMASKWLEKLLDRNRTGFRKLFCETPLPTLPEHTSACECWKKIRTHHNFHELRELIVAMTVDLTLTHFIHPSHTAVAITVLVAGHFLDKFCDGC